MTLSTNIEKLALAISDIKTQIETKEKELKQLNISLGSYELELGELMTLEGFEVGSTIQLANGRKLKIKEFFNASMVSQGAIDKAKDPSLLEELYEKKERQLKWLEENNLADIVKNKIVIALDRGESEVANQLMIEFQEKGLSFTRDESVHASTLNATLKKEFKNGNNVPKDLFGIHVGTKVEIK